jgi:DNA-binding CsgD family transcriptional regulator
VKSELLTRFKSVEIPYDQVTRVYRYAIGKGAITAIHAAAADLFLGIADIEAAIECLVEYRLLREENHAERRLVPVDPEIATVSLVSPMEREIYQRREQIARIHELIEPLRQDYAWGCPSDSRFTSIEHVAGAIEVAGYLKLAGDACDTDVIVIRPSKDAESIDDFLQFGAELAQRGIMVRVICEHRSRADFTTRMKVKHLMDDGAIVRTVSHVPRAAVIFDQSSAVLLGSADGEPTASRVRDGRVIQFLLDMFGHTWDAATAVRSFESGYAEVADDLQLTIAGLMAKGFTDEVLARKLGMSVRTCRRHIAAMMHDLDAVSRFQAGVRAASLSLVREA